jgi:regulatory protein
MAGAPRPSCRADALRLLSIRGRAAAELARALSRRGHEPGEIHGVLAELERGGWLDERAAAESFVSARMGRMGRSRMRRELSARGFSEEVIEAAVGAVGEREERNAFERAFRRLAGPGGVPADPRGRKRIFDALVRRGFPRAMILARFEGASGGKF